ncbi:amino acid adenylation domain-containing protein [Nocardiopsis sp. NPDC049922]|uniref:non-ribosomal peptide synthetase n=1 Tax=Nocardiopsis sp. NPDC049922 TaxID=3155157 RepID=UPI00340934DF
MTLEEQDSATAPVHVPAPRVQHRLWVAGQLTPHPAAYLGCTFLRLRGPLDTEALTRALTEIVDRHQVLRTSVGVRDGELVGTLHPSEAFGLGVEHVRPADLDEVMRAEASAPLDIERGLPLRARLLRLGPDDHVLSLTVHHLAFDRGSVRVLCDELETLYAHHAHRPAHRGEAGRPPLEPLTRQFRDIALEEDARHDAGEYELLLERRREALAELSPFELPPDRPRPPGRSGEGALHYAFELPAETVRRLADIGRGRAASLYMVLLAACQSVLYRHTGRTDVTTGTSSSTRRDPGADPVIGPFLNMLVIPGDVSGDPSFGELVSRVRDRALDAYEARLLPFNSVLTALGTDRDPARTPLFQVLVDFTVPVEPPSLAGLRVEELPTPGAGAKYDLTIEFHRTGEGVGCAVEWDTALYDRSTITRLTGHLRRVLTAVADDPDLRTDRIPMLGPEESRRIQECAVSEPSSPSTRCLHELFTEQADRTPDAVAVEEGGLTLTYAELDRESMAIARALVSRGVGPDVPVGVLLDRSVDMVTTVLGILKAGGAYLPIDPETPPHRIGALLSAASAPVCVVPEEGESADTDLAEARAAAVEADCATVDPGTLRRSGAASQTPLPSVRPAHLCTVYFTSGSTGTPKGVASTHQGWVGQMGNMQRRYRLSAGDAVLLKTPLSFDDVGREIFWTLMVGGRIVVVPPGLHRDPRALLQAAIAHRVRWLQFVPSMLALFLEEIGPEHLDGLSALRHVVSDGDRLSPETVRLFFERLGPLGCQLNNHWGTTEVSIDSTHHECDSGDGEGEEAVALGRPMENHAVYVLDHTFQPVPVGAFGELCIGGTGLARGYLADPGRTARAFIPHPWRPGERLYRTGDTGRLLPGGSFQYGGRGDHQVKIRGIRIELGEVEAAVRAFPGVSDAVATVWEPAPGDRRIVAYAAHTSSADGSADAEEAEIRGALRDFLVARLTPAAVPGALVLLPRLPRNPSGKVNRRALPPPDPDALHIEPYTAPETDAEEAVVGIWASVLGRTRLGVKDDFFAAGGHSLLVTRAVNRMREAFGVDVPVRLIFEHPTVRETALRLEEMVLADIESMSDAEAERLAVVETPHTRGARERADVRAL